MTNKPPHGAIPYPDDLGTDFLYRVSIKCLIRNTKGEVLVVKETGRDWWDLPGGGMDHGEGIQSAIAREMKEEVNLGGEFAYKVIAVEEPAVIPSRNIWQLRLIFEVKPHNMTFSAGDHGDEIAFMDPQVFKDSGIRTERRICARAAWHMSATFGDVRVRSSWRLRLV